MDRTAHWARSSDEQEQLIHVTSSWTNKEKPREIEDLRKEVQKESQASTLPSNSTDPNPVKHLQDTPHGHQDTEDLRTTPWTPKNTP